MLSFLGSKSAFACSLALVSGLAVSCWPTSSAKAQIPEHAKPLPIELYGNHILVRVSVNRCQNLGFILDTGASAPFLNRRRISECDLGTGESHSRGGVGTGERSVQLSKAKGVSLKLDSVDLSGEDAFVLPLDDLERVLGRQIDGILGPQIFEKHIVEIDYEQRTLRLNDVKSFSYTGPGQNLPIQIRNHRPFLVAKLEVAGHAPQEGVFVIDIGDNSALSLHTQFVSKHKLLPSEQDAIPNVTLGLAGGSRELIGRAQNLQIGNFVIPRPITAFSQATKGSAADGSYDGAIGGEILRRFKLIFDYSRRQLIMEPNIRVAEPFEADMSGLSLAAQGDGFQTIRCKSVDAKSPASEAGFLEGDIIQSVDGELAVGSLLPRIRELFREEGKTYTVRVQRDGKAMQLLITMRRRI